MNSGFTWTPGTGSVVLLLKDTRTFSGLDFDDDVTGTRRDLGIGCCPRTGMGTGVWSTRGSPFRRYAVGTFTGIESPSEGTRECLRTPDSQDPEPSQSPSWSLLTVASLRSSDVRSGVPEDNSLSMGVCPRPFRSRTSRKYLNGYPSVQPRTLSLRISIYKEPVHDLHPDQEDDKEPDLRWSGRKVPSSRSRRGGTGRGWVSEEDECETCTDEVEEEVHRGSED